MIQKKTVVTAEIMEKMMNSSLDQKDKEILFNKKVDEKLVVNPIIVFQALIRCLNS